MCAVANSSVFEEFGMKYAYECHTQLCKNNATVFFYDNMEGKK